MEEIKKISSDLGNRIKGTYGATFVLVWFVYNWRLVFILLNFDEKYTLVNKLKLLNKYIEKESFSNTLWYPVLMTLISIITYYFLNYITFTITTFFNLTVKPSIQKLLDKNSLTIVSRDLYNNLKNQFDDISKKYSNENEKFFNNNKEIETLKIDKKNDLILIDTLKKEIDKKNTYYSEEIQKIKDQHLIEKVVLENTKGFIKNEPIHIFNGKWEKSYSNINNLRKGKEIFNVHGEMIFINEKATFKFKEFKINDNRIIDFTKIDILNNRELKNTIFKVTNDYYIGIETDSIDFFKVEYKRFNEKLDHNNL